MFNLLKIADTQQYRFHFVCSEPSCDYEEDAEIETEGQFGVYKAVMLSHIVSHLRPM